MRRVSGAFRTVTALGRSLVLVGLVAFVLAEVGDWPAARLVATGCLVLAVLALLTLLLPARVRVQTVVHPPRTVAGAQATVEVRASAAGMLPVPAPVLSVPVGPHRHEVRLPVLWRGTRTEELEFSGLRRGVLPVGPVTQRRGDVLGLLAWEATCSPVRELLVLPRTVRVGPLGTGVVRDQEGRPSDEVSMSDLAFHALREYVPGDDLRHVHWRSSAKTNTLQVRQYLDSRRSHLTLVIDEHRESYAAEEDFETAVSIAASLAIRASEDGVDLSVLCGEHAVTGRGIDGVLEACCRIELGDSDPLQGARQALRLAPETSWLVLITGGAAPDALRGAVRAQVPREVQLAVVQVDQSVASRTQQSAGMRMISLATLEDLPKVVEVISP